MNDKYVPVKSMTSGTTVLFLPEYHLERVWPKRGVSIMIDKDILRNTIYEPGVQSMFVEGRLWIDDKDFRIELGLEASEELQNEEANISTIKIVELDEKLLNRIIKLMPANEVENTIKQLSEAQKREVIDYAVQHYGDLKMDRIDLLSQLCGSNLMRAVQMKKDLEEA